MKMLLTAGLVVLVMQANAPAMPDFSGTWKIDPARGSRNQPVSAPPARGKPQAAAASRP